MSKLTILTVFLILCAVMPAEQVFVINSESRTLSRIDTATNQVQNSFAMLDLTPNRMAVRGDSIFVVCSGSNSVQVLSAQSGQQLHNIFVAPSSNPWDLVLQGQYMYVTGYFSNKVYKISLHTYTTVDEVTVGSSPEGLTICNGKLYVGNTGGYASGYENSSVSVIDLASFSVITTIPVWHNPQDLQVYGHEVHVACTGNWASISGAIDIIDSETDTRSDRILTGGNPWSLWIGPEGTAYIGEGYNSAVYSYHAGTHELAHGAANPLSPGAVAVHGNTSYLALLSANWGSNGIVYLRNHDWSPITQYSVGLVPTDLWCQGQGSAVEDETQIVQKPALYPNPVSRKGMLHLKSDAKAVTNLVLYNLRGQQVLRCSVHPSDKSISLTQASLCPGIYLYRLDRQSPAKLVIY